MTVITHILSPYRMDRSCSEVHKGGSGAVDEPTPDSGLGFSRVSTSELYWYSQVLPPLDTTMSPVSCLVLSTQPLAEKEPFYSHLMDSRTVLVPSAWIGQRLEPCTRCPGTPGFFSKEDRVKLRALKENVGDGDWTDPTKRKLLINCAEELGRPRGAVYRWLRREKKKERQANLKENK